MRALCRRDIRKNTDGQRDWDFPEDRWLNQYVISRAAVAVAFKATDNPLRNNFLELIKLLRQFRIVPLSKMQRLIRQTDACKICHYAL